MSSHAYPRSFAAGCPCSCPSVSWGFSQRLVVCTLLLLWPCCFTTCTCAVGVVWLNQQLFFVLCSFVNVLPFKYCVYFQPPSETAGQGGRRYMQSKHRGTQTAPKFLCSENGRGGPMLHRTSIFVIASALWRLKTFISYFYNSFI